MHVVTYPRDIPIVMFYAVLNLFYNNHTIIVEIHSFHF